MHLTVHRTIFWAHLICGIVAGIIILSMSVTGLLIAYETQLTDWANRHLRVTPPTANAVHLDVEALVAKVKEAKPDLNASGITWKGDPGAPVTLSQGREGTFFANPYTGEFLGEGDHTFHDFFHAATDWHRFLSGTGLPREVGKTLTGTGTLVFGVLLLSGIYLWWPKRWRWNNIRAVTLFNRKLKGRARDWNWHNVIGFWSAFPMLFIILTGLIMSYTWANNLLYRATGNEPPPPRARGAGGPGGGMGQAGGPRGEGGSRPEGGNREGERGLRAEGERGPRGEGERGPRSEEQAQGEVAARGEGERERGPRSGGEEGGFRREGERGPRPEGEFRGEGERGPRGEGARGPRGEVAASGEGARGPRGGEGGFRREGAGAAPGEGGPRGEGGFGRPSGPPPSLTDLSPLLAQVRQENTGWQSLSLRMPQKAGDPFPVMVDQGGRGQVHLRTMLNLDVAQQKVLQSPDDLSQQNLGRRLRMYSRYLHTGELFGFFGQTVAALCTLAGALLVWTGFALAWRRFFKRKPKAAA